MNKTVSNLLACIYFLSSMSLLASSAKVDWDSHLKIARNLVKQDLKLSAVLFIGADLINDGKQLPQTETLDDIMKIFLKADDDLDLGPVILNSVFVSAPQLLSLTLARDPTASFLSYYQGAYLVREHKWTQAVSSLQRVNPSSPYWAKSRFYLGVARVGMGRLDEALKDFEIVLGNAYITDEPKKIADLAHLNMARIYYEQMKFSEAISQYALISRSSEVWLPSLLEASWAFVLMNKPNNSLGNIHTIHSPFFYDSFYPESFVLASYSFLKMCRFDFAKATQNVFLKRYENLPKSLKTWADNLDRDPMSAFESLKKFKNGLSKKRDDMEVVNSLIKSQAFLKLDRLLASSEHDLVSLKSKMAASKKNMMEDSLVNIIDGAKHFVLRNAAQEMKLTLNKMLTDLTKLLEQSKLIQAEVMIGNIAAIKNRLFGKVDGNKNNFIGGMQELKIPIDLEYWPFEGEYWEDELGGYVYNLSNRCSEGEAG